MKKFEIFEAAGCCSTSVSNPEEKRNAIRERTANNTSGWRRCRRREDKLLPRHKNISSFYTHA